MAASYGLISPDCQQIINVNKSHLYEESVLPDPFLLICFLIQNPEEAEVRLRSYSYSSPKAKPSRPLLNRDATVGDLAEGE